jgi:hypothetical protein
MSRGTPRVSIARSTAAAKKKLPEGPALGAVPGAPVGANGDPWPGPAPRAGDRDDVVAAACGPGDASQTDTDGDVGATPRGTDHCAARRPARDVGIAADGSGAPVCSPAAGAVADTLGDGLRVAEGLGTPPGTAMSGAAAPGADDRGTIAGPDVAEG